MVSSCDARDCLAGAIYIRCKCIARQIVYVLAFIVL